MSNGSIGQASYARTMASAAPSNGVFRINVDSFTGNIKKEKKMGWFKRKFAQWSREAWEKSRNSTELVAVRDADTPTPKSSVRFAIYPASGGWIIEHSKQERYKDNDGPSLTIITDLNELGKTVEHLITLEALRS
jgi:hypothetical protein